MRFPDDDTPIGTNNISPKLCLELIINNPETAIKEFVLRIFVKNK